MRLIVVDDEAAARRRIVRLAEGAGVEVVGEAADGLEALALAARLRPDAVLLDVTMPEVSGLDVARRLPSPRPLVIFVTAHDEFAVEAFEREAIDYLLKPVTRERLAQALDRARRRLAERMAAPLTAEVAARLQAAMPLARPRRLLVRYQNGHRLVAIREVVRFAAREGLVSAVMEAGGQHLTDDSLDALEARLSGLFVRTSRSDLVAVDRIDRIVGNGDGSATLKLHSGEPIRVSRRRAAAVRRALER
jgi:two-component system LytT family response regulator